MKNKYLKLILSITLVVAFVMCTMISAFAKDPVTPSIIYDNDGFRFVTTSSDVFLNFDNLLPGKTISQDMKVVNGSSKETDYFIKVSYDDSYKVSASDKKLAAELVDKLLTIRIEDESGKVVYTGAVSNGGSKDGIKIATLAANSEKLFKVFISADKSIGNEYQNFSVEVNWSFIVGQDDTPIVVIEDLTPEGAAPPSGDGPITIPGDKVPLSGLMQLVNTADLANPVLWICIFGVAVIGVIVFVVIRKKKGKSTTDQVM